MISKQSDWSNRQWSEMDPDSRRHARWLYRSMRRNAVPRSAARMYLHGGINVGYLAGVTRAIKDMT